MSLVQWGREMVGDIGFALLLCAAIFGPFVVALWLEGYRDWRGTRGPGK